MNGKRLLDTNIVIALFAEDPTVQQKLTQAAEVLLPSIVVGELYFGAYKSRRVEANVQRIHKFITQNAVLVCDQNTAQHYGKLKNDLKTQGKPIPENDLWVAALALQYDFILVTRDEHFDVVHNLRIESW